MDRKGPCRDGRIEFRLPKSGYEEDEDEPSHILQEMISEKINVYEQSEQDEDAPFRQIFENEFVDPPRAGYI